MAESLRESARVRIVAMSSGATTTTSGAPELRVRGGAGAWGDACGSGRASTALPLSSEAQSLLPIRPQVSETWDSCIENTITKLAYGTIFGGLAAIPLFRAPLPCLGRPPAISRGPPSARAPAGM